jgi:hypothetical protein
VPGFRTYFPAAAASVQRIEARSQMLTPRHNRPI